MPLSNVERQVLALICDEHRQTRRGAKTSIVHIGMNAANSQQKARVIDVLTALKKRGLVVFGGNEAWMLTGRGAQEIATDPADLDPYHLSCVEAPKHGDDHIRAALPVDLLNRCAAMNATLMAQAKQAYAAGEPDAWRDLHWLMETAQQLVRLGGKS